MALPEIVVALPASSRMLVPAEMKMAPLAAVMAWSAIESVSFSRMSPAPPAVTVSVDAVMSSGESAATGAGSLVMLPTPPAAPPVPVLNVTTPVPAVISTEVVLLISKTPPIVAIVMVPLPRS